jgi:hypothetical protein
MRLQTWLRLLWCVGAYCGCGGAEFTVSVFPDGGEAMPASGFSVPDAPPRTGPQSPNDGSTTPSVDPSDDAGAPVRDAGTSSELDAPSSPPSADAADEPPPPPPPALCCLTPCGGSTPAPIACGNGPAWTCAAGSCSDRACAASAVCEWMGSCTGRVGVCP